MLNRFAIRLLIPLLAACASGGKSGASKQSAEPPVRSDSVVVRVANRYAHPLTVSVARQGKETTLGEVGANGSGRFVVPAAAYRSDVSLVAGRPGESTKTAPFRMRGGAVVWFDITPELVGSKVRLRWPEEGPPKPPTQ